MMKRWKGKKIDRELLKGIRLIVLDVDGVLTDGKITYTQGGEEVRSFSVYDGLGIRWAMERGIRVAIVSGRFSQVMNYRAKELGIEDIFQGVEDKGNVLDTLLEKYGISEDKVCAIGDDLPDLEILKRVGFPVVVANGVDEVKRIAKYVTEKEGGNGAIREVVDMILNARR